MTGRRCSELGCVRWRWAPRNGWAWAMCRTHTLRALAEAFGS